MNKDTLRLVAAVTLSVFIFSAWEYFFPYTKQEVVQEAKKEPIAIEQNTHFDKNERSYGKEFSSKKDNISNAARSVNGRKVVLENSKIKVEISTTGALISSIKLKKYFLDKSNFKEVELIDGQKKVVDCFFKYKDGFKGMPALGSNWNVKTEAPKLVSLEYDNSEGLKFVRDIELNDDYLLTLRDKVINASGKEITLSHNVSIQKQGDYQNAQTMITHEGMVGVIEDKLKEVSYKDLSKEKKVLFKEKNHNWLGIADKYWLSVIIPGKEQTYTPSFKANKVYGGDEYIFKASYSNALIKIEPGEHKIVNNHFFIGPKEVNLLDLYEKELNIKNFDKAIDFGILYIFTKPLFYFLNWLFNILGSMAWVLVLFTLLSKLAMLPLAMKSSGTMSKMKKLKPEMDSLQEKFKDDKAKLNTEMMALYKREKVNPAAGCLPIIIQIPIMFALYKVLNISIHMHNAPFWGWVTDLSSKEPYGLLTLFGFVNWHLPGQIEFLNIGLWPIIMGITAYIQQKLQPQTGGDPAQQKIMSFMPVMMVFLMSSFPVGVIIYWSLSNIFSIIQQYVTDSINSE